MKVIIFTLALGLVLIGYFRVQEQAFERGYQKGHAEGKAEAQTPAFIVETCSAWWFGSNKEAAKMLKTYCEMKK